MKTRFLAIAILLFTSASASAIYFIYQETGREDGIMLQDPEEITIPQDIQEKLEEHPVYLAMKERFPALNTMIRYDEDVGYLLIADHSPDGSFESPTWIRLAIVQDERGEKKYTSRIDCNANYVGSDYLRDVDKVMIEYIKNTNCLEIKTDPDIVYFSSDSSPMTEDEIKNLMKSNPVYLAMKERFPDATEESETFDTGRIEIRVGMTNHENGNKLALTLASSNRIERVDAYAQCLDKDNILLYQKHSHALEYISNTNCLEYDLGSDYTIPPMQINQNQNFSQSTLHLHMP